MFLKTYKVKTSTTLKGSERKKLRSLIESQYSSLSAEDLNSMISSKNELRQTKALVHSGAVVIIYSSGSNPLFFLVENSGNRLFPTLYTLWRFPDLLPILPTVPAVLEKICNGADLMAPGIVINESTIREFQNLKPKDACAVRLEGNRAPIAVGTAVLSDTELLTDGRKGKAVLVVHCYKDNLWASGDQTPLPLMAELIPDSINIYSGDQAEVDHQEVPQSDSVAVSNIENEILELGTVEISEHMTEPEICEELANEYSMDDILNQCFMLTLKANGKKIPLPVLTSTFYRTYVLKCCPPQLNLDIKKTTHKKLSVFLKSVSSDGLIDVKELTKGVESIVTINLEHDKVKTFVPDPLFKEHLKRQKEENVIEEPKVQDNYKFPDVVEMYAVSAQVKMLFESMKIRKGDALTASKIRELLREYVKENSLQVEDNPRMITLDPILTSSLLKSSDVRTTMTWEELFEVVMSRMSPAYMITFKGEEPKLKKGHIDLIDVSVATRTGNKKVTLISNLENFGIKPEKLANYVQVAVAASTSVSAAPNGKGTQVLIQGNQLHYLQTLFFDIYKVPKKYVRGLESVSSKKKKK